MRPFLFFVPLWLIALPTEERAVAGDAVFSRPADGFLEIAVSDGSILEWGRFSIEENERVRFAQPNAESVVLNRAVGSSPSRIDGRLEANGKVLLMDPHGILIGPKGTIDTGAFLASSLASIENRGSIFAKEISLLGQNVSQKGVVQGESIVLTALADLEMGGVSLANGNEAGGAISLSASLFYLHPEGRIEANGSLRGGSVAIESEFCFCYGEIGASGNGRGGDVEVSGRQFLDFRGTVKASGTVAGTLLLDPTDIELRELATTPPPFAYPPAESIFSRPGPTAVLNISDLVSQLSNGTNVTVQTTPGAGGPNGGRITVRDAIRWDLPTRLTLIADENIIVRDDVINDNEGAEFVFSAGNNMNINPANRALIRCGGPISVTTGNNLLLQPDTKPVEIASRYGNVLLNVGNNLTIVGGSAEDARARIAGQSLTAVIGNDLALTGGVGADASAEITHFQPGGSMAIDIGRDLVLTGGTASKSEASIFSAEQLTLNVARSASILSGTGDRAQIKSRNLGIELNVGSAGLFDLTAAGDLAGGAAIFSANGDIAISSTRDILLSRSRLTSSSGGVEMHAAGSMSFSSNTDIFSQFDALLAATQITFDRSSLQTVQGTAGIQSGAIQFLDNSELIALDSIDLQGASLTVDDSSWSGRGNWSLTFTGGVSFSNGSSVEGMAGISCSAASLTCNGSTGSVSTLDATLTGAFDLQNSASMNCDVSAAIACGSASILQSSLSGNQLSLLSSGACAMTNGALVSIGPLQFSGTTLAMDQSTCQTISGAASLLFSGNITLIGNSNIQSASDLTLSSLAVTANQSRLASEKSSIIISAGGAVSLLDQSFFSAATVLQIDAQQIDFEASQAAANSVVFESTTSCGMVNFSAVEAAASCSLSAATLCNFSDSSLKAQTISIDAASLQMTNSMIHADSYFKIDASSYSLMNSSINSELSNLGAP